jgi:putative peptidoglycan lipid II flippase
MVVLLALPCAVALLVVPQAVVAVLFHYGAFNAHDVAQTTRALMGYGVGLLGIVSVKVLAPAYYARLDVRTPVRIAIVVLVATQLMNLVLVPWLGHAGLALSIGLGACVNALWLLTGLLRRGLFRPRAGWGAFVLRLLVANVAMGGLLHALATQLDWVALQADWLRRVGWMAVSLVGAGALYFAVLAAVGLRWRQFVRKG